MHKQHQQYMEGGEGGIGIFGFADFINFWFGFLVFGVMCSLHKFSLWFSVYVNNNVNF